VRLFDWFFVTRRGAAFEEEKGVRSQFLVMNEGCDKRENGGVVGWVDIENMKRGDKARDSTQGITSQKGDLSGGEGEGFDIMANTCDGVRMVFNEGGMRGAATDRFASHSAAACKQIEETSARKELLANIEESGTENALCGSRRRILGCFEATPFESTS
jgi:hypothetical protein